MAMTDAIVQAYQLSLVVFENCEVLNNHANGSGGFIVMNAVFSVLIRDCLFHK